MLMIRGEPATKLVELSETAALVVIGSVGGSSGARALLGSVATDLAAGSHCPVAVIRPIQSGASAVGPVVVVTEPSLSGSPAAVSAAFQAAADRHADVLVVDIARPAMRDTARAVGVDVEAVLDDLGRRYRTGRVRLVTYFGHARTAIEKFSITAQLVVVGRSRRPRQPHLGDSLRTALRHTRCAVLVVPEGTAALADIRSVPRHRSEAKAGVPAPV
ncbi:universal stress protein [Nocardia cyriacigeorgica]|nr:universal stress protein [Nocardia cyriacigeorgica]